MGNGPAGFTAIIFGIPIALIFSYFYSAKRNKDGSLGKVDIIEFIASLILSGVLVMIAAVFFTFA